MGGGLREEAMESLSCEHFWAAWQAAGVGVKVDEAVGGSLTVDEESVEPEVEEIAFGHVPRPAENVKHHLQKIYLNP